MTKIIVVTEFVSADKNRTGYYWSRLVARAAHEFSSILVLSPTVDRLAADLPETVRAIRLWPPPGGKNLARRAVQQLSVSLGLMLALLRHARKGDTVLAGTNPALQIPVIALLRRLLGFRWVQVTHDVFPLNLEAAGVVSSRSPVFGLLTALFSHAYRAADGIVVIGRDMGDVIAGMGVPRDRIAYIPNWAPVPAATGPDDRQAADAELGWEGKIVIQFFGNMGRAQGIPELLDAIRKVDNDELRFLFAGGGAMAPLVEEFAASRGDVKYLGPVPIAENQRVLDMADICLVTLAEGMKGLGVPSKSYFSLAADKYLLYVGETGSEIWRLVKENAELGWAFEPGDRARLAAFLNTLTGARLAGRAGERRRFVERHNSEAELLDRYMGVIRPAGSKEPR